MNITGQGNGATLHMFLQVYLLEVEEHNAGRLLRDGRRARHHVGRVEVAVHLM